MLESQIEQDLKTALLSGDRVKVETLRGLKSALLYSKVEKEKRDIGLTNEEELQVLTKESKKRADSIEAYTRAGSEERANQELIEKEIIDQYLPKQLTEDELKAVVLKQIKDLGATSPSEMGKVILAVKSQVGAKADGGTIASMVKKELSQ